MQQLKIGLVGAGANTVAKHIPGLLRIPGVSIKSVCNRSAESSSKVAKQFDIPEVRSTWEETIADKDLDAIVIGTWPNMHHPITVSALNAGKHVLCEARMAMNAREAHEMLAASTAQPSLVAQVVPAPDTFTVDVTVKRLLAENYIGELLAIELRVGNSFLDSSAPLHWRQDRNLVGFNTMSMGIWYESLMRWVGEASSVFAAGRSFGKIRRDASGASRTVQVPDHLDIVADMVCGAQAHFQISKVAGLSGKDGVFLFGSTGTLWITGKTIHGAKSGETELAPVEIPEGDRGQWRVEEDFIGAIRGENPVRLTTFSEGVKYMEFTEAVARSISSKCSVTLPLSI